MKDNISKTTDNKKEALRLVAQALLALADQTPESTEHDDPWLDMAALKECGFTRESLRSAAEKGLPVRRGPRGKIMVRKSHVDAWIESRPWKPGPRKTPARDLEEAHEATAKALGLQ